MHAFTQVYSHHTKNNLNSLITDTPYKAGMCIQHTKNYQGSLLTIATHANILMDRKESIIYGNTTHVHVIHHTYYSCVLNSYKIKTPDFTTLQPPLYIYMKATWINMYWSGNVPIWLHGVTILHLTVPKFFKCVQFSSYKVHY